MRLFQPKVVVAAAIALSIPACSDQVARPCDGEIPQHEEPQDSIGLEISGPENPVKSTMLESVCVPVVISTAIDTTEFDELTVQLGPGDEPVTTDFANSLPTPESPLVGELRFDLTESPAGRSAVQGLIEMTGGSLEPKHTFILEIERSGDEVEVSIVSGMFFYSF